MHQKNLLLLLVIVGLTFSNTLLNGFVGDDDTLIVTNEYYRSWSNITNLFSPYFITDQNDVFNEKRNRGSGAVAYRPVAIITFFFDYWIWQLHPFGYHLSNLCIHLLTSLVFYFFIFEILKNKNIAFISSLIYSVHPIQTESVAAIAYRTGLLAIFFVVCSFLFYLYANRDNGSRRISCLILSSLFYFLALFTKESAIVLPLLIIAYEWSIHHHYFRNLINLLLTKLSAYILITCFYLYIYLIVFPNASFQNIQLINGSLLNHIATMLEIFRLYLWSLIWPFNVKILPPLYFPPLEDLTYSHGVISAFIILLCLFLLCKLIKKKGPKLFFFLWFFIALMPTSNIIPIANPMAYRFLNLPAAGLFPFAAIAIYDFINNRKNRNFSLNRVFIAGYILFCMIQTFLLNTAWKNNMVHAMNMTRDYPNNNLPYLFLGIELYQFGQYTQAEEMLQKGISLGLKDPRAFHYLGLMHMDDLEKSKPFFERNVQLMPTFGFSYIGLGRYYLLKDDYQTAHQYLKTAVDLIPNYRSYGYLIQYYLLTNQADKADKALEEAKKILTDKQYTMLQDFVANTPTHDLPVDLRV